MTSSEASETNDHDSNLGGTRKLPYAFTENGVAMLSSVLRSPIAIEVFPNAHDRFLCIDDAVYHIGASLKDLGKNWDVFQNGNLD